MRAAAKQAEAANAAEVVRRVNRRSRQRTRDVDGRTAANTEPIEGESTMIQMQTRLAVADNTGAKEVMCIKVLGGSRRRFAGLGDIIICSVKSVIPGSEVKKKAVVRGVIVRPQVADAAQRRQLRPVRQQRRGADRQRQQSPRHAHFRRRRPRAARPKFMKIVSLASEVV